MPDMIDLNTAQAKEVDANALVPKNTDYNDVFGNFSRNLYTNFTKIFQTDVNFFVMVPPQLLPYYFYIVLQQLYWYRGFVPGIHNAGIVSQQLGGWICETIANLTAAGGFHVEVEDEKTEDDLVSMMKKGGIHSKLTKRLAMLNAGGFALAYATHLYGEDTKDISKYNINFVDCNRHFAKVNAEGEVKGFVTYIKTMTPDPTDMSKPGYYLVLKRWMEIVDNVEYCLERYFVFEGPSLITTPTFEHFKGGKAQEMPNPSDEIVAYFKHHIGDIKLNETVVTPFVDNCGASIIHNSYSAAGVEEYSNFSNGTLFNIINQLYEFDMTRAQKSVNKYMAVTKVLLPDNFYSPPVPSSGSNDPDRYAANVAGYHNSFNEQLGHQIFKKVPYVSASEQSPFFFQAKNESDTYNKDIKFLLSEIAAKIHISPNTLAPFISEKSGLNQKTAKEVSSEENETRLTVHTKRELISTALECLLVQITKAAGKETYDIQIIFNNEEVSNPMQELDIIEKRLELGLTSKIRARRRANRNLSKRELAKLESEIQADIDEEHSRQMELKAKAEPVTEPKPTP